MGRQSVAAVAAPKGEKMLRIRQRQKLIDACITALHQYGPSRTTIDKVVAIADMSPGIVNFYFETKAALLVAALEYLAVEFEERVQAPLEDMRGDPVRALPRLIELYLDPDIASPRKVSVWYAFWGEASSRQEYQDICGKRDQAFADLVRDLMARLIAHSGAAHLNADSVALGLIGALEMMWQDIAFREEADVDREGGRQRCLDYLASVFPAYFGAPALAPAQAVGGEAYAMLVAAELTLAGVPAFALPQGWLGYDVVARPRTGSSLGISVRGAVSGAVVAFADSDTFAFLALVLPAGAAAGGRRYFLVPRAQLDAMTEAAPGGVRRWRVDCAELDRFERNFCLSEG